MGSVRLFQSALVALVFAPVPLAAQPKTSDTRLLAQPAVSATQVERAITWVEEDLRKNPPVTPKRPAFPDKTKRP